MIKTSIDIAEVQRFFLIGILLSIVATMLSMVFFYGRSTNINVLSKLNGTWKISLEDDPRFSEPNFDDSAWDTVNLPGSMISYSVKKLNKIKGILWIRKHIDLPPDADVNNLGLILGRIGNADVTYINGKKVGGLGEFPPHEFSMWNHPRNYPIPPDCLEHGKDNVIAVRISYYNFCEVWGKMAITDSYSFSQYNKATTFSTILSGYITIAIGQVLLIFFGILYIVRPESKEYFYYCLPLFFGQPIIFELCTYWDIYPNTLFRFKALAISFTGLNVTNAVFLHRLFDMERKSVERLFTGYFVCVTIAALTIINDHTIRMIGPYIILIFIGISTYNIICYIAAIIFKKPLSLLFGFFGIGFSLFITHDSFVYLSKFSSFNFSLLGYRPAMTSHLAAVLLYLGTASVMIKQLINVMEDVEILNESLESYIIENTILNDKLKNSIERYREKNDTPGNGSKKISTKAEKKIIKVMSFINDNYSSNISRSTLADSFDIHPDSLGKAFKHYTGKKLGDYIYELRIEEASRRLRDEETNIIDIAYDVGFESLRTFQRIFPKFMGTTPDAYRKKYQEKR